VIQKNLCGVEGKKKKNNTDGKYVHDAFNE
jgi:hypothetical protein